ncbi:unnamed protein product [Protopolystoma xenopodis]|uniref:Uncharacterized protein n=1 Tax=Protopolystoma xenopodis TaxID=117903 RepID=A0A3S5B535_9PLAT|nr:unnamed protein product [Protopolystoma xenopodis]
MCWSEKHIGQPNQSSSNSSSRTGGVRLGTKHTGAPKVVLRANRSGAYEHEVVDTAGGKGEDAEEDEEEDEAAAAFQRQKAAFSARLAAGRPSIRRQIKSPAHNSTSTPSETPVVSRSRTPTAASIKSPLSAFFTPPPPIPVSNGVGANAGARPIPAGSARHLRAWRQLAKKVAAKAGRQRLAWRRERQLIDRKAFRDLLRLHRQKALLSQKIARDAVGRFSLFYHSSAMGKERIDKSHKPFGLS